MRLSEIIKSVLRKSRFATGLYRRHISITTLNITDTFPLFAPYSAGNYKSKAGLTVQAINQSFPFLRSLAKFARGGEISVDDIATFPRTGDERQSAMRLKVLLDRYGSDKASHHNYHHLYGAILHNPGAIENIFEIGLGTNNIEVVSNMGSDGRPGASLRAFRDYCPNAKVYGADIDRRVLFEEDRIRTFFIDQTDPASFDPILAELPSQFDLVIDDGLHSPNANFASLELALRLIKVGGWAVIEDIGPDALSVWHVVAALLSDAYKSHLLAAHDGWMFAVQRLR